MDLLRRLGLKLGLMNYGVGRRFTSAYDCVVYNLFETTFPLAQVQACPPQRTCLIAHDEWILQGLAAAAVVLTLAVWSLLILRNACLWKRCMQAERVFLTESMLNSQLLALQDKLQRANDDIRLLKQEGRVKDDLCRLVLAHMDPRGTV